MAALFGGADAISAINTIKSVTMADDAEVSGRRTVSGYSGRAVKPIALRFILEMAMNHMMKGISISGIGGHQAITFDATTRQPHIVGTKCVGCHLCRIVCPAGAIGVTKRVKR